MPETTRPKQRTDKGFNENWFRRKCEELMAAGGSHTKRIQLWNEKHQSGSVYVQGMIMYVSSRNITACRQLPPSLLGWKITFQMKDVAFGIRRAPGGCKFLSGFGEVLRAELTDFPPKRSS